MKNYRFASALFSLICILCIATAFTSCQEEEEDFLSLPQEEETAAMTGSWKLTKASTQSAHYLDDETYGLTNDLSTSLTGADITETDITFHFSNPVPLVHFHLDEQTYEVTEQEEMVSSIKCPHVGTTVPGFSARRNFDRDSRLEFVLATGLAYENNYSTFSLYGKNEKATRIIMNSFCSSSSGNEAYFEFVRR